MLVKMFFSFIEGVYTAVQDWRSAGADTDKFLHLLKEKVPGLKVGCTFLPEKTEGWGEKEYGLKILQALVETLLICDIRIGIRWDKVEIDEGVRTLEYYLPYLNYLATQNVRVTVNIGPIKSCGWPEIHVPKFYVERFGISQRGVVKPDGVVGEVCYNYTTWLLSELKQHPVWGKVIAIQPENESFNPFGDKEWTVSHTYLKHIIKLINNATPKDILLNSSGLFDAQKIINIFHSLPQKNFILGIDYYYTSDRFYKQKWTRVFDHLTLRPNAVNRLNLRKLSTALGFRLEVTEAQFEPWGRAVHPGQTRRELHWTLLRSARFCDKEDSSVIRLWGIEQLVDRLLQNKSWKEDGDQIRLIQKINKTKNPSLKGLK